MKLTKRIRNILERIADNSSKNRQLNKQLNEELSRIGVDINSEDFISAMSYVEGDCDTTQIIKHLEETQCTRG